MEPRAKKARRALKTHFPTEVVGKRSYCHHTHTLRHLSTKFKVQSFIEKPTVSTGNMYTMSCIVVGQKRVTKVQSDTEEGVKNKQI